MQECSLPLTEVMKITRLTSPLPDELCLSSPRLKLRHGRRLALLSRPNLIESNDNPLYINKNSNHPPSIKKQIPSMVNDRLIQFSSSENEFDRAAPMYNKALHESGYEIYLKYRKEAKATKTISNRRR